MWKRESSGINYVFYTNSPGYFHTLQGQLETGWELKIKLEKENIPCCAHAKLKLPMSTKYMLASCVKNTQVFCVYMCVCIMYFWVYFFNNNKDIEKDAKENFLFLIFLLLIEMYF